MTPLDKIRMRAEADAKSHGYFLNPDPDFLRDLMEGLSRNEERYGYPSCPCRLAAGSFELDRDIICPCDYRDLDVQELGACYCALYVRKDIFEDPTLMASVPERRPAEKLERVYRETTEDLASKSSNLKSEVALGSQYTKLKMWFCKQCGYVCFRNDPPLICPICKAERKMFEKIPLSTSFKDSR